jgi:hypothetical protein
MAYKVLNLDENLIDFRRKYNVTSKFAGDSAALTTDVDSDLVGAINEIDAVFDASANQIKSTGLYVNDSGNITLDAGGGTITLRDDSASFGTLQNSSTNLVVTSTDITLDASDDIFIDADGGNIKFQDGGADVIDFNIAGAPPSMSVTGGLTVLTTSNFTVDAAADVILDADGADVIFKDAGTEAYKFTSTGVISRTGDITVDVTGDITLDAAGDDIIFMDAGAERWRVNLDASPSIEATGDASITGSGNLTIDAVTDITLDADDGDIFLKDGGVQFGSLTNTSGNLIVKSGTTTAATFSGANVDFAGTLDVTGNATFDINATVKSTLSVDTISEYSTAAGVTIDSVLVKDNTVKTGTLTVAAASITDTSGSISFGNENLTTTGNTSAAQVTATSQVVTDTIVERTAAAGVTIEGVRLEDSDIFGDLAHLGTLTLAAGSITDSSGAISFGNENLTTTGSVTANSVVTPTISQTGSITLDATTDIILDADGADVTLKDGGTTYANFQNNSGNLRIQSGSTPSTALTFSGANATFSGTVSPSSGLTTTATDYTGAINELVISVALIDGTAATTAGFIGNPSNLDSDEFSYATKAGGRFNIVEMMSELGRRMVDVYDSAGTLLNVATP